MSQEQASSDVSGKLIRANSCNANGIPLCRQLFRRAMAAVGGLVSSAVAAMLFQRASVDVRTCVHGIRRNARWAASKHGVMGPPIHLQPVTSEEVYFGPTPPGGAPFHSGNIPPPATCDPHLRALASQSAVAGADAANPGHKIFGRILALAREIRSPRAYVQYCFFVMSGLARTCKPHMWAGHNRVNLLSTFAPWGWMPQLRSVPWMVLRVARERCQVAEPKWCQCPRSIIIWRSAGILWHAIDWIVH